MARTSNRGSFINKLRPKKLMLILILLAISGIAKAIMDTLQQKFHSSKLRIYKDNYFVNPELSWLNKYKDRVVIKGAKFLFSTTVLVWVTDL